MQNDKEMLFNKFSDILFATGNKGKLAECTRFFHHCNCIWHSLTEFPTYHAVEDGENFQTNAYKKACEGYKVSGYPCLAEDSGLVVPALHGEPGVYSARYGGENLSTEERNAYLVAQLQQKGIEEHTPAYYHTSLILYVDTKTIYIAEGRFEGEISFTPKGSHGFGYDPLFYIPSLQKRAAELTIEEKNSMSHRGKAMRKFLLGEVQKSTPSAIIKL